MRPCRLKENLEKEPITLNILLGHNSFELFGNLHKRLEHDLAGQNNSGDLLGGGGSVLALRTWNASGILIPKDIVASARGRCHVHYHGLQIAGTNAVGTLCYDKVEPPSMAKPFQEKPHLSSP